MLILEEPPHCVQELALHIFIHAKMCSYTLQIITTQLLTAEHGASIDTTVLSSQTAN